MLGSVRGQPVPLNGPDWTPFLPGIALWALALYLPLSKPLERLEQALAEGPMKEATLNAVLVVSSLLLALAIGTVVDLLLSWALGPDWASSLGLVVAGWGLFLSLASRRH
jgi:protein-S-isoprenylcysteine O-methyltransferase Ste14